MTARPRRIACRAIGMALLKDQPEEVRLNLAVELIESICDPALSPFVSAAMRRVETHAVRLGRQGFEQEC